MRILSILTLFTSFSTKSIFIMWFTLVMTHRCKLHGQCSKSLHYLDHLHNLEYLHNLDHLDHDPHQVQTARSVQERNLSLRHRLERETLHHPGQILALLDLLDGDVEYNCSWGKQDQNLTVFASHSLYSLYNSLGMSKSVQFKRRVSKQLSW